MFNKADLLSPVAAKFRGCFLGLAAGDAVGTTLEFKQPGTFTPITDMVGGGPFNLKPGEWTDDTAMAMCLADSIIACRGINGNHQLHKYAQWKRTGLYSVKGYCFDCGGTCGAAINRYEIVMKAGGYISYAGSESPQAAGNGSLMRLAPAVLAFAYDTEKAIQSAGLSSKVTHAAPECIAACKFFAGLLCKALRGQSKETILNGAGDIIETLAVGKIAAGSYKTKSPTRKHEPVERGGALQTNDKIIRGTGFVLDCLEAALWAFYTTDNYRDAVLAAANLGDDADTTAAVCGQLAGAFYGEEGIPAEWRNKLAMRDKIVAFSNELYYFGGW